MNYLNQSEKIKFSFPIADAFLKAGIIKENQLPTPEGYGVTSIHWSRKRKKRRKRDG